jgi:DNA-binding NarL/FixJ family response regulator
MVRRILLADDHAVFRRNARALLESKGFVVTGEAANGLEAVRLARQTHPDLALLDLTMPVLGGLDAARQILRCSQDTRMIALTVHQEEQYVLSALQAGMRGYILKAKLPEELEQAVGAVLRGEVWVSPGIRSAAVEEWVAGANLGL